ncbi:hypothetical protein QQS21_003619 [Conoideocrella luteorostrata]|uniref:FAD-binding domain-containing protein n=1 Tax=Conoideocrella luteorostrata TaxID=1105319 RepID=A0AAJ0CTX5_9HYPO|nr:hypothetical protein QQS21_003619 [Conoideocrella luteorostrata]
MSQTPVRIIGAGIGGLTLARCLLRHGIPSIVYERMPSTPRHAYGITLHKSSYLPLLQILGLDEWTFKRRIAVDGSVGGCGKIDPNVTATQSPYLDSTSFRAHREKFERLLQEGLDIQWGHALDQVKESPLGMTVCLQNGQQLQSACIVGVDGPHSNTRKSFLPNTPLDVLPFVAFNGRRQIKRVDFDKLYSPAMGESSIIETRVGDVVLHISVNDYVGQNVSISWIYSRPARGSSDPLYKPNRPVSGATDIPEEFYEEIKAISGLEAPFSDIFDADKLQMERFLHWLMRTVLVGQRELDAFAKKGVFFMGDSVHAQPILGGNGANGAILDGIGLAKCIAASGADGISSWYAAMYPEWEKGLHKSVQAIEEMHGARKLML